MTKEKVIDILKGIKDGTAWLMPNMPEDGEKAIDIAIKAVEQSEPHWIPVTERLPNRDELVLVTYKTTSKIHLCKYLDDGSENSWWSYIDDCCAWNNVILAWMPLPEPYKGVTE